MSKLTELTAKLSEILQIDRPDLDFGIYRVINARAGEITDYLARRLPDRVKAALGQGGQANLDALKQKLAEAIAGAQALKMNPEDVGMVRELRQQIDAAAGSAVEYENAVYSHLLTFFSRYYDQGDFISQRRYKGDTYAIPYAGEEVVLHWANKDQYYTKSGEVFANYSFRLEDGRLVHFRLIAADTAKDNRKDNDKERRFVLIDPMTVTRIDEDGEAFNEVLTPVAEEDGALVLRFAYQPMSQGTKQAELLVWAVEAVLADAAVKARWQDLTRRAPTDKSPFRTVLEKHLTDYTARNTADYFIHKDLGSFLRRELDFYIKNEVMNLDDLQNAAAFAAIETQLRTIQTLRAIALDLVAFLAQLEDFQKRLWLKKKFVVAAHYCLTMDRVPKTLWASVAANPRQWSQWRNLGVWNGADGCEADFESRPHLMMYTALYDTTFTADLLKLIPDLNAVIDGLLVNGDNFQSMNLLNSVFRNRVSAVYADPPYNTDAAPILYKNGYKDSSWLTLIHDRILSSLKLIKNNTITCITIDDVEVHNMRTMVESSFEALETIGVVAIKNNPAGRTGTVGFSTCHEYALFFGQKELIRVGRLEHSTEQKARYKEKDENGFFEWTNFRKHGGENTYRVKRPRQFYPIYVTKLSMRIPQMRWNNEKEKRLWEILEEPRPEETVLWPIDEKGRERIWDFVAETAEQNLSHFKIRNDSVGKLAVYRKWRINEEGLLPQTIWDDAKFSAAAYGTNLLADMFGDTHKFTFPKSVYAVAECLKVCGLKMQKEESITLDFFAGSGTTAHAVILLNREDQGNRRYILVEQGEYFDTVLVPRIQKVVFSHEWKGGRPSTPHVGISHGFKAVKIESYEDTLNNLALTRSGEQTNLLDSLAPTVRDDYVLRYMMDVETRGSLLSVADFRKPFDYKLRVAFDSAGSAENCPVDLVETFNYLIGLTVKTIDLRPDRGFAMVRGVLPDRQTALILWRDCDKLDYEGLLKLCDTLAINPADSEHDVVYVNGDHTIPTVATADDAAGGETKVLKLRQIEPAFLDAMFSMDEAS